MNALAPSPDLDDRDSRLTFAAFTLCLAASTVLLAGAGCLTAAGNGGAAKIAILGAVGLVGLAVFFGVLRTPSLLMYLVLIGVNLDQWEGVASVGIAFLTLTKAMVLLAAAILCMRAVLGKGKNPPFVLPTAALAALPFAAVCLVSTLAFGYSLKNSIRWVIAPVFLPIMSILLCQFIQDSRTAVRLLRAFAVLSFFPMVVAGIELVLGRTFYNPEEIISLGVQDILRVAGNFENPNNLVVLLLFSVPLLLVWAIQTDKVFFRVALLLGVLLQGMVLLKTYSRSGLLSMVVVFVALVILGRGRVRGVAILACVAGFGVLLLNADVVDRLLTLVGMRVGASGESQAFASLNYRKLLAFAAWNEFTTHPWLGVGFGNFGVRAKAYSTLLTQVTAENTYLQVLAEMGLVGFVALIFFFVTAWFATLTGLRRSRGDLLIEPLYVALAAGYCGFAFISLFDTALENNLPWILLPIMVRLGDRSQPMKPGA